jgi:hypothetical protein
MIYVILTSVGKVFTFRFKNYEVEPLNHTSPEKYYEFKTPEGSVCIDYDEEPKVIAEISNEDDKMVIIAKHNIEDKDITLLEKYNILK